MFVSNRNGSIIVDFVIMFDMESRITTKQVTDIINATIDHCSNEANCYNMTFSAIETFTMCGAYFCNNKTTTACRNIGNGVTHCQCNEGLGRYSNTSNNCIACPNILEGDICEGCPFGYSGQDCKDFYVLILLILGILTGVVIIITAAITARAIYYRKRLSKGQKNKNMLELSDYMEYNQSKGSRNGISGFSNELCSKEDTYLPFVFTPVALSEPLKRIPRIQLKDSSVGTNSTSASPVPDISKVPQNKGERDDVASIYTPDGSSTYY
ncbi:uncharacterized protein LOC116938669 isoform X2 [Petromyzon marinus]|uniref:uncharacterized protein LOC116938669 isoform X2 n=1 Tax=Petromyzon marinus TaxID=7757 RepID=UPI003F702964